MSAARKGKGPSTKDKVISSVLAVGAMTGIAGLLAFQTSQAAMASGTSDSSASVTAAGNSSAKGSQASYDAQVANYKQQLAGKSSKVSSGSQRTNSKPTVTAPQKKAPQATTKGS
jgi:hypothetical protein